MADTKFNDSGAEAKGQSPVSTAFGRLSRREQTMIYVLIVLGIICAFALLLFRPGLDSLNALEAEATDAETTQEEYSAAISQGAGAEAQITEATTAYDAVKAGFFSPMNSETLDSAVTGYLTDAGFDPGTLSMSPLAPENPAPFAALPLSGMPAPDIPEDQESTYGETTNQTAEAGASVYSYSVSATASGGWKNLYKLIDMIADVDGVEITQYSYSENSEEGNSKDGSFSMTIKIYVLVEEAPASEEGTLPE
jgi:hypothetical protein